LFSLTVQVSGCTTISVAVADGSGVDVTVADGTNVSVGAIVFVAIAVGVGADMRVEHPAKLLILQITIMDIKSLYVSFDVISFFVLI
jgi:hypothetical protein